jgi:hypothetical protein
MGDSWVLVPAGRFISTNVHSLYTLTQKRRQMVRLPREILPELMRGIAFRELEFESKTVDSAVDVTTMQIMKYF